MLLLEFTTFKWSSTKGHPPCIEGFTTIVHIHKPPTWHCICTCSSVTAPQDAHKKLVLQVAEWLTASYYQGSGEEPGHAWVDYITFGTDFNESTTTFKWSSAKGHPSCIEGFTTIVHIHKPPTWHCICTCSSVTAPQDAHKKLVLQVAEWLTASYYQGSGEEPGHAWVDYITFSKDFKK